MEYDYLNSCNEHVIMRTGKSIDDWIIILDKFRALEKTRNQVIMYLHYRYHLRGYRAEALNSYYMSYKKRISKML
jgi:hypothetical protein